VALRPRLLPGVPLSPGMVGLRYGAVPGLSSISAVGRLNPIERQAHRAVAVFDFFPQPAAVTPRATSPHTVIAKVLEMIALLKQAGYLDGEDCRERHRPNTQTRFSNSL
jgi:hypothetical protein